MSSREDRIRTLLVEWLCPSQHHKWNKKFYHHSPCARKGKKSQPAPPNLPKKTWFHFFTCGSHLLLTLRANSKFDGFGQIWICNSVRFHQIWLISPIIQQNSSVKCRIGPAPNFKPSQNSFFNGEATSWSSSPFLPLFSQASSAFL
jgi:hypothetical protein